MVQGLPDSSFYPPKLVSRRLSSLLYAADAVLLSHTNIGLRYMLWPLASYYDDDLLTFKSTKRCVTRRRSKHSWMMNENPIEQLTCFKYLGVLFQSSGSWEAQIKKTLCTQKRSRRRSPETRQPTLPSSFLLAIQLFHSSLLVDSHIPSLQNVNHQNK